MKPSAVTVQTSEDGSKILVKAPFNPEFNAKAKNHGGRWDTSQRAWVFDVRVETPVRETLRIVYGTDSETYASATVTIDAKEWWGKDEVGDNASMYFAGRKILARRYRDSPIELCDGVTLIEGSFKQRGGSTRYPSLDLDYDTIIQVFDVPLGHPDLEADCVKILEIKEIQTIDLQALKSERERLSARLAEIDAILNPELSN
jgi:hypothetical protein